MKSFFLMLIALIVITIVTLPVIVLNVIRKVYRRESMHDYFFTIAIGFDQAGGSILYGQEDWTVSSWTYHLHRKGNVSATYFMEFINFLSWDRFHCENSFFEEAAVLNFEAEWM